MATATPLSDIGANMPSQPNSDPTSTCASSAMNEERLDEKSTDPEKGDIDHSSDNEDATANELYDWPSGDPDHPHNWKTPLKLYIGGLLTCITMIVSINSSIYITGAQQEMKEFNISSEVNTLGTSLYLVGFIVGPPFWGPVSERFGRKRPLVTGLAMSGIFTIMPAAGKNVATIMVGRFLSGVMGASPISIVAGAATDNWNAIDRGIALACVIGAVFSGPFFGPIIGDFISQYTTWRWTMWLCVIGSLALAALAFLTLPETYAPVLLTRKTKRLRKETGNEDIKCKRDLETPDLRNIVHVYLLRPWVLFGTEPILVFVTLYQAFIYGILYLFFTSYHIVFFEDRGWALGVSGLPIIGVLIGVSFGTLIAVIFTKTRFARLTRQNNGVVIPEIRLPLMVLGGVLFPAGLFWFAWTSNPAIPWESSAAASIMAGTGMFLVWIQCFTYIIDVYLPVANSALAANGVIRSLFGAGFPLFATQMYHNLGAAWATTLLAFLAVAMVPIPVLFYIFGERIRGWSKNAVKAT